MNIKILVAGPGTGKTTKFIELISQFKTPDNLLVISFTNTTVNQLRKDIKKGGIIIPEEKCTTLHRLALRIASPGKQYILTDKELGIVMNDAKRLDQEYEKICEKLNCKDFSQVIRQAINYAKTNPALVKERLGQIDLLLVDEFQDFNVLEQELILELAKIASETWVAGDDDQAIYDFKHANPQGIIDLHNTHPKIEHEGKCFRCPKSVIEKSLNLIRKNSNRVDKKWLPVGNEGFINAAQFKTKDKEVEGIISKIHEIKESSKDASIMILYPMSDALHTLPTKLLEEGINFTEFAKELRPFYELKHLLSLFLMNDPFLHLRLLLELDKSKAKQFYDVVEKIENMPTTLADLTLTFDSHKKLLELIKSKIDFLSEFDSQTIKNILDLPTYSLAKEVVKNAETAEQIIEQLNNYIEEQFELDDKGVNLMTIHKSKGLEADYVFIIGATEGVLPNVRPSLTIEGQRRLMFVALTRCKSGVFISTAFQWPKGEGLVHRVQKNKFKFNYRTQCWEGSTSSFLTEMDCEVKESFDQKINPQNN